MVLSDDGAGAVFVLAGDVPEEGAFVEGGGVFFEEWGEGVAVEWSGVVDAGEVDEGGEEVEDADRGGGATGGDLAGPVDHGGDFDAALVDVALGAAEFLVGALASVVAVVGSEDDGGVFAEVVLVEEVDDAFHVVIE